MLLLLHFLPRLAKNEKMEHIFRDKNIILTMAANLETLTLLHKLTDNQWSTILKQLIIYAELRLNRIGFEPRSEIDSVNGEDFAMEAIKKLFEGERKWDHAKHPDLLIHLKLVVKSLISNHIKSSVKSIVQKTEPSFADNGMNSDQFNEQEALEDCCRVEGGVDRETQLEIIITQERWGQIEAAFGEDADSFIVFCEWLDEIPPRVIAENYSIDVKNVYNTIKKGKRIITKIYAH